MKSTILLTALFLGLGHAMCDHRLVRRSESTAGSTTTTTTKAATNGTTATNSTESTAPKTAKIGTFGYDDLTGPLNWHGLSIANSACAVGRQQSPINVDDADTATGRTVAGRTLNFNVEAQPQGAELENLGTTLEVPANGTIVRDNVTFKLKQFHFHTPSEHRVRGEYYPMEAHFVFQNEDADISVVGVMIEVAPAGGMAVFRRVFRSVEEVAKPGAIGETPPLDFTALAAHVANSTVYQYGGSLTTPPCTEGVAWNVVMEPAMIDVETYKAVKSVLRFNSRFSQGQVNTVNLVDHACEVEGMA